jgi:putative hydrolase
VTITTETDEAIPSNADLAELLVRAAENESDHRRLAMRRAARAARSWPEEAAVVATSGRSLTAFPGVGPWIAETILGWLAAPPPIPPPPPERADFLTTAEVNATLAADPGWAAADVADLQVHSTDSDGSQPVEVMAAAAHALGRTFIACTDHSRSLRIANGMDDERLRAQGRRIQLLNEERAGAGDPFRLLRSIEMDVFPDGSSDAGPEVLAELDLVLGAFHSKLRERDDQTERYLTAVANPDVMVLAHPTARMFDRRSGLRADWDRVFALAAETGIALEIDATPHRQDLTVELARRAVAAGVRSFSIGSDAHAPEELRALAVGFAIAARAGVPRERILNVRTADDVVAWGRERREESRRRATGRP